MKRHKKKNITAYEAFMQMDIETFAKYALDFFKDIEEKNDNVIERLKSPIGVIPTKAFYTIKSRRHYG